jgi:hypothetical protein
MFASFGLSVLVCLPFLVLLEPTALVYAAVLSGHVLLSLLLFRYSRALFLALDYYADPAAPGAAGDGGDGAAEPARPRPAPGISLRRAGRRPRASRKEREPAGV